MLSNFYSPCSISTQPTHVRSLKSNPFYKSIMVLCLTKTSICSPYSNYSRYSGRRHWLRYSIDGRHRLISPVLLPWTPCYHSMRPGFSERLYISPAGESYMSVRHTQTTLTMPNYTTQFFYYYYSIWYCPNNIQRHHLVGSSYSGQI